MAISISASRAKPARSAFERKLDVLEPAILARRLPDYVPNITTLLDFQNWEDSARGISAWSNTGVLNKKGVNADLRARLDAIWTALQAVQGRGEVARVNRRSSIEKVLEQKIETLNLQVVGLIVERDQLKKDLRMKAAQFDALAREHERTKVKLSELKKQSDVVVSIVPNR